MKRFGTRLCLMRVTQCLAALWLGGACRAEEPLCADDAADLMRRGAGLERAGKAREAAAAYEQLLQRDTSGEAIVAPRLVDLYIAQDRPDAALAWAKRVASRSPEPQAYLAGVYARLRQWKESELILRRALAAAPSERRLPLLWQLAEAQEGQGDVEAALATLAQARDAVQDAALRETASLRLAALQRKTRPSSTNRPPQGAKPTKEAQP